MSGSSLDGLDLAVADFTQQDDGNWTYAWVVAETAPYDAEWAQRLATVALGSAHDLAKADADLGHLLGMRVREFCLRHGLRGPHAPHLVASHGHTVLHHPERHFTCQIGSPETLVSYLEQPLVADFRTRDVALGGQGAPLVPRGEELLFQGVTLFLNLGGIANLSVLEGEGAHTGSLSYQTWLGARPQRVAYDLTYCNQLLDHLYRTAHPSGSYDAGGELALQGIPYAPLLRELAQVHFYHLRPPRSLGNDLLTSAFLPLVQPLLGVVPLPDLLATCCVHVAEVLATELDKLSLRNRTVLITGGGAHNQCLMQELARVCAQRGIQLHPAENQLIDYKEALIFGLLGVLALRRQPNVLHTTTGAKRPAVAGSIHLPESYTVSLLG